MSSHTIEILYFEGCPHARDAVDMVRALVTSVAAAVEVREVVVTSEADAQRLRFLGSPTVRVDGRDVDPTATNRDDYGLQCRVYADGSRLAGLPPVTWIQAALAGLPR